MHDRLQTIALEARKTFGLKSAEHLLDGFVEGDGGVVDDRGAFGNHQRADLRAQEVVRAAGAECVAVATGAYTADELQGADRVLMSLTEWR